MKNNPQEHYTAIDLGSNSFHMVVARLVAKQPVVLDRIREAVRLADGLDANKKIDKDAQKRAIECLRRFGQRLRETPQGTVRAVGTNTFRAAGNARAFLDDAIAALGHPIEIISGREEARLVYLGVSSGLPNDDIRRLVVDIGGGSTELIVGQRAQPIEMESLQMGCVTMTQRHFSDGEITRKRMMRAILDAESEVEPLVAGFARSGWSAAIGSSGTVKAIDSVLTEENLSKRVITRVGLEQLADMLLSKGHVNALKLKGLGDERVPVFAGGVAILLGVFIGLGIEKMHASERALREGLLYDLIGRSHDDDTRNQSVAALATRFHADQEHGKRVAATALSFVSQVCTAWPEIDEDRTQLLDWAAQLHEIGQDVSHSQYHKHGSYVIENADLMGFSRSEQKALATLVRVHRRKINHALFDGISPKEAPPLCRLAILLRLSVVLNRSRSIQPLPTISLGCGESFLVLRFPPNWLVQHPLTVLDLEHEAVFLRGINFRLEIV